MQDIEAVAFERARHQASLLGDVVEQPAQPIGALERRELIERIDHDHDAPSPARRLSEERG